MAIPICRDVGDLAVDSRRRISWIMQAASARSDR
jgi:hypothetical protein